METPDDVSGGAGRKSRGYFPKSKQKREEMVEKRRREEEEKKQKRERREREEAEEAARGGDGADPDQAEADDANIDIADAEAVDAFLRSHYATHFQDHLFESMILYRSIPVEAMQRVGRHRISNSQLAHIRNLFAQYEGTHCYHNFTPGGRSTDASCHRYIKSVTVSDPVVWHPGDALLDYAIRQWSPSRFYSPDDTLAEACEEMRNGDQNDERLRETLRHHLHQVYPEGIEVVRIELDGQSFMLNQIRKMIGAVVCLSAAGLPASHLHDTLMKRGLHIPIPMVPANGLLLAYLDFSGYGNRLSRIQKNGNNGKGKEGIDVAALMPAGEVAAEERRIVSVMLRNEMANDVTGKWMRSLRHALRLAWKVELP